MTSNMIGDRWMSDWPWSERYPQYTRANAGEVLPDPSSPLNTSLVWHKGVEVGRREGYTDPAASGTHRPEEIDEEWPEGGVFFGGYHYIGLTLTAIMGARLPGMTIESWNKAWIGDRDDIPPHPHRDTDEDPEITARMAEKGAWALTTTTFPEVDEAKAKAKRARESRPDLTALSDAELIERARSLTGDLAYCYKWHCPVTTLSVTGPSVFGPLLAQIDELDKFGILMSGFGDVDSAKPSYAMWEMGRIARSSPVVTAAFEGPVTEILDTLRASDDPAAAAFVAKFDEFTYEYGSRAPNEWDIRTDSWETKPETALVLIDQMRRSDDSADPVAILQENMAKREALTAELAAKFDDEETRATFLTATASAARFMPWRERTKTACIRIANEMRVAVFELGRRMVERGIITDHHDVTLLLDEELDDFIANPESYREELAERRVKYLALYDLEPPFFLTEPIPISEWKTKAESAASAAKLGSGDVIQGTPGAPGVARGIARIINDPFEVGEFGPGDVLVAPQTDPAWTPLFVPAAAVVVNVGALITHAVIISRELGLPCVVSARDATLRIPDGAMVEVNGTTGEVTIL